MSELSWSRRLGLLDSDQGLAGRVGTPPRGQLGARTAFADGLLLHAGPVRDRLRSDRAASDEVLRDLGPNGGADRWPGVTGEIV